MGLWTYALSKQKGADATVVADIKKRTAEAATCDRGADAEESVSRESADEGLCVGLERSGCKLRDGITSGKRTGARLERSWKALQDDLHYLLGRNTFSLSWVTQVGMNPYHTRTTGRAERTKTTSHGRGCCRAGRMPGGRMMR